MRNNAARTRWSLIPIALAMLLAVPAQAKVHSFRAVAERDGVAIFKVRGVSTKAVTSAHLLSRRRGRRVERRLELRKVREGLGRGRVRIRLPRSLRASGERRARPAHHRPNHKLRVVTDTTPPDTTISSGPSGTVADTSASFSFTSTESGSTYECMLDSGTWAGCGSPKSYSSLTSGSHTFQVRAVDAAGNIDPTSAARTWTVQTSSSTPTPTPAPTPTPTPPPPEPEPTPDPGSCAFGGFGPGAWPPSCWRPFAATSPFNRAVPTGPALLAGSAEKASYLAAQGNPLPMTANNADSDDDWQHPYFFAKDTDPLMKIDQTRYVGPHEGEFIRVPAGARAAGGGDAHMTVIQPSGQVDDFYDVTGVGPSSVVAAAHGRDHAASGDGLDDWTTTAAWFSNLAGIIRAQELEAGQINHALFAIVRCTDGAAVYPAKSGTTARTCSSLGVASGGKSVPMGARLWLDMSDAQIDALPAPAWKKTIVKALAHYGAIVGDTGAYGQSFSFGLQFESGTTYTAMGYADKMAAWAARQGYTARPSYMGLGDVVDWGRYLRVVHPCVSQGGC